MARSFRRGRGRRTTTKRKSYWVGAVESFNEFQLITATPAGGYGLSATFWTVWPSDRVDPLRNDNTAADRTLVRTILNAQFGVNLGTVIPAPIDPAVWCLGLIAFDGGFDPSFYDQASWNGATPGAPPHPVLNIDDDWIIRLPFCFTSDGQYQGPAIEPFMMSRAMRKLPPGWGVLGVVGGWCNDPNGATHTLSMMADFRHHLKMGYTP